MAAQESTVLATLDRISGVTILIAETSMPWTLDIDALIISVGRGGLGMLGYAFREARPDVVLPDVLDIGSKVTPASPLLLPIEVAEPGGSSVARTTASSLRWLVCATVRDNLPGSSGEGPASIQAAVTASINSVLQAGESGATRIALPILGTGAAGLDVDAVVVAVLSKLRQMLRPAPIKTLAEIVLVAPDEKMVEAIRRAWTSIDQGVQLSMLADLPIGDPRLDLLGTKLYAEALAFVIDHRMTSTPLTIAINAPWGAGKTSVARLTENRLKTYLLRSRLPITCWFNAWHHDDAPHIVSALASTVARAAARQRPLWRRVLDPLPTRMLTPDGRRRRYWTTLLISLAVGVGVLVATGAFHDLTTGKLTASVIVTMATALIRGVTTVRGTAADVGSLVRAPESTLASGSLDEVRSDVGKLIHQATRRGSARRPGREHRRLIVFIDDLERCQPARSIEVCETVSSLLSHEDVVVVLIGDMQTLATAAETKYQDLAPRYRTGILSSTNNSATASFGELYLEKIIQFRFDLPTHDLAALAGLAKSLEQVPEAHPAEGHRPPGWVSRLSGGYRNWRLQRRLARRDSPVLAPAALIDRPLADTEAEEYQLAEIELVLKRVEGPSLQVSYAAVAHLVRPLPRDLKRLLNRIRFYLYLLEKEALLTPVGPVSPEAVGKWALLAERWPDLAAAVSSTPTMLAELERASTTIPGFMTAMTAEVPGYARSAELQRLLIAPPALGPLAHCLARLRQ
jgi:KAP family P-loop domain